jgi:hypothetical protein
MYRSHYGNRKTKSGLYSESKLTNWSEYNPYNIESGQVFDEHFTKIMNTKEIIIEKYKTHPKFVLPISVADIEYTLSLLPEKFTKGIKGIFLLSGTNKQEVFAQKRITYGGYYYYMQIIMLHPFPYNMLDRFYKKLPAPHKLNEFKRAGARVTKVKNGWNINFSLMNLRNFYLNDVLIHEIGHHIDKTYDKSDKKVENFAEYFVQKYSSRDNR